MSTPRFLLEDTFNTMTFEPCNFQWNKTWHICRDYNLFTPPLRHQKHNEKPLNVTEKTKMKRTEQRNKMIEAKTQTIQIL